MINWIEIVLLFFFTTVWMYSKLPLLKVTDTRGEKQKFFISAFLQEKPPIGELFCIHSLKIPWWETS